MPQLRPTSAIALVFLAACMATPPDVGRVGSLPRKEAAAARDAGALFAIRLDDAGARCLATFEERQGSDVLLECLYVESLVGGLGSNPVGLDRGQLGDGKVVRFRRLGDRVLLEEPNLAFRALSGNDAERDATRQSFASSVLWAGEIEERSAGRLTVDLTSLVVRDAHGSVRALDQAGQGRFRLDAERSALLADECVALPDNIELEALLTFSAESPGPLVRATAPSPEAVSLIQHHSFIRLPDSGYTPRAWDPRSGAFSVGFVDTAARIQDPNRVQFAVRHRLERASGTQRAVEPIVYYVDRGAPEPVRSALLEGAGWWSDAFRAAGFEDGFRVELLPEDIHPMDVRYNVIQWVHRSTRGWSYGGGIRDPRTGEMISGRVTLGSLRVRQDRLLFEGLAGVGKTGSGAFDDPVELALARIRQLAAHEVGHTLGLAHNFAASTRDRASVMDYPAPLVTVGEGGELDFRRAYDTGIGEWDEVAIRWLYSEFGPEVDERRALDAILDEATGRGLLYLSDADARPAGAAHPDAALWDNGSNSTAMLREVLEVRRIALERFGAENLAAARPQSELEEVLVPLYFHHRYQADAVAKRVGGIEWRHAVTGSGPAAEVRPVAAADQRGALDALLAIATPETLDLPESVLRLLVPTPPGTASSDERFASRSAPAFDPLGAAETGARMVADALLQPERCLRLVDQHRRDESLPGLDEVLRRIDDHVFRGPAAEGRREQVRYSIQEAFLAELLELCTSPAPGPVLAEAEALLRRLSTAFEVRGGAREMWFASRIRRHLERPQDAVAPLTQTEDAPPGSPIGHLADCACPR